MRTSIFLIFALAAVTTSSAIGCAADTAVDDERPTMDSSDLSSTAFTRLDTATADDVADESAAHFGQHLDACFARHPNIATVTKANVDAFTQVSNVSYTDVREAIEGMLDAKVRRARSRPSSGAGFGSGRSGRSLLSCRVAS